MTTTNHTPGPWGEKAAAIYGSNGCFICDPFAGTRADGRLMPIDEREANARLIIASLDLLNALQMARAWMLVANLVGPEYDADMAYINATIAKARGE